MLAPLHNRQHLEALALFTGCCMTQKRGGNLTVVTAAQSEISSSVRDLTLVLSMHLICCGFFHRLFEFTNHHPYRKSSDFEQESSCLRSCGCCTLLTSFFKCGLGSVGRECGLLQFLVSSSADFICVNSRGVQKSATINVLILHRASWTSHAAPAQVLT